MAIAAGEDSGVGEPLGTGDATFFESGSATGLVLGLAMGDVGLDG